MQKFLLPFVIVAWAILLLLRLLFLQLLTNTDAEDIRGGVAVQALIDYPERGHIYDRMGKLLVSNQSAYDIMIVPREVRAIDTLEFCALLSISPEQFKERYAKAYAYSPRKPSVFVGQLSKQEYAPLQEKIRKYAGFYAQQRSLRHYHTRSGGNILGYISEVSDWEVKEHSYYLAGELIGRQGVERQYEDYLRGRKGVRYLQKDKHNRVIGSYKEGKYDTLPEAGKSLELTISDELQAYGESLMVNKRGSIVAIEPSSGEILALVSAPSYDPNLLVGRRRSEYYNTLYNDSLAKPLFDRALLGEYPPGSTFKPLTALISLQEGVMTPQSLYPCYGGYHYGNRLMKCHAHGAPYDMQHAIATSCNAYFAHSYRRIVEKYESASKGVDAWSNHLRSFGLGEFLGSDFPTGRKGLIPNAEFYNRHYGTGRWSASYNISNGIGQGEILTTPLQLANILSAIANRGYFYTPHIVRKINQRQTPLKEFITPKQTTIAPQHFETVIKGMHSAYTSGTAAGTRIAGIEVAAKTGTAENYIRVQGKRMQLTDHSIFVAFAPIDQPKIAIVVVVENGYFGARIAGPISSLMIEKYLTGGISRPDIEQRMLQKSLQEEYEKPYKGVPFTINR